jgi:release factor glutamine methyltransferase
VTVGEVLRKSADYLQRKSVDSPRLDAELLLGKGLGLSRLELYTHHDRPLTEAELDIVRGLVERRGRREPLAYILGEWGFHRLTLKTDARALVPRPETETVVERALTLIASVEAPRVVDVGTGSGAIALAIKSTRPDARVTATDVSPDALALARENAERLGLEVELVQAHLLEGLLGPFDLVVSNPPYVSEHEIDRLQPEVREWEPRVAVVDRGQTRELAEAAGHVLAPGGFIVLECHEQEGTTVAAALAAAGYREATITPDLAGRDRVVEARWEPTRLEATQSGRQ